MKRRFAVALVVGLLLAGMACSTSNNDIRRVANESVATALAALPTVTPAPTVTPQPTPSPLAIPATPTPFILPPLPTPVPTATPFTFPPTVTPQPTTTPQPTATPQPTLAPVVFPPTPTPTPTSTPTPSSPTGLTAVGGQVSGPGVFQLPGDFSLTVDPSEPLTGRDVTFTLAGLPPWQEITVEFTDPLGRPAQWVTENEVVLVGAGNVPVTALTHYADGSGRVSWTRVGTKDQEGTWTVRVTLDGEVSSVTYPVTQLQLLLQDTETVGVELRRYQGSASNAFYSTLVPAATAIDLQAHLVWVVERLGEELGVHSKQIPDIYLAGNQTLLQQVARATGNEIGFEDGYYLGSGNRPGFYMRTNLFLSSLRAVLTHEYTHLLLREVSPDQSLPAWLNEGLARHSEYTLVLQRRIAKYGA